MTNGNLFFREMLREEAEQEKAIGMKKLKPQVVYKRDVQHGTTNIFRDKRRKAMPSGKRISKAGNVYYEYRKNRTDKEGSMI